MTDLEKLLGEAVANAPTMRQDDAVSDPPAVERPRKRRAPRVGVRLPPKPEPT